MTTDERHADTGQGPSDEPSLRGRTEQLVSQLAELYNENTLLRERVRRLEREVRNATQRS